LENVDYYYGLVLECEDVSEIGHMDYPYRTHDELTGISCDSYLARKIVLFSFYEQKVVVVNQTLHDVPDFPEIIIPFEENIKN